MKKKILVTGATGNVGRYLVPLLAKKGESVKAATRHPERYAKHPGVEAVAFDYEDDRTVASALDGVDCVFITARSADPDPNVVVNPFIDKVKEKGVRRMVLMTAMGVDQAPDDAGYRKLELHLMHSGVDYTILRPNWFMQNFNPGIFLHSIKENGGVFVPAGDGESSLIDTRDIAAVAALALTAPGHEGKAYTLTGGRAIGYAEATAILSEAAGREIRYGAVSPDEFRNTLEQMGMSPPQIEMMASLYHAVREGWTAPVLPTVTDILGREPITFEQFAKENAGAWW